jgi:hypothetical protein
VIMYGGTEGERSWPISTKYAVGVHLESPIKFAKCLCKIRHAVCLPEKSGGCILRLQTARYRR